LPVYETNYINMTKTIDNLNAWFYAASQYLPWRLVHHSLILYPTIHVQFLNHPDNDIIAKELLDNEINRIINYIEYFDLAYLIIPLKDKYRIITNTKADLDVFRENMNPQIFKVT
jgi:hypothetical protein